MNAVPFKTDSRGKDAVRAVSLEEAGETPGWLIPGCVPRGGVTLLTGDSRSGVDLVWASVAAGVSSGQPCLLEHAAPAELQRGPGTVLILDFADSVPGVLIPRLLRCGACLRNIRAAAGPLCQTNNLKIGSQPMEQLLLEEKPDLCIMAPVQGYIHAGIQMDSVNAMYDCTASLVRLAGQLGTAFLLADRTGGADLTAAGTVLRDISCSVLVCGPAGSGLYFVSQTRNSLGPLQPAVLYSIDDGADSGGVPRLEFQGTAAPGDTGSHAARLADGRRQVEGMRAARIMGRTRRRPGRETVCAGAPAGSAEQTEPAGAT